MSFLDRLKREADQQRLQAEQLAAEREARETRYRSQIEPKMKALNSYLEGLAATLLEVKPPIVIRMAIQGYGDLCTVPFWDYKVEHERRHRSFAISMAWSLRVDAERTPVVRADGVTRVKALSSIFRQFHLGGIKEEKRTPQGELSCATFHARGYIKARMEATISADDPVLRLMFENASWLGASRRQVPCEQIDDNLFDRIGRFVVREDDSLFTEELSDALRQKLRKEPEPTTASPETAPPSATAAPRQSVTPPTLSEPAPMPPPKPESAPAPAATPARAEYENPYTSGSVAALAPLMQGEMIEIDESKLGLADFSESDEPISVFSPAALSRPPPPMPAPSMGTIPAPPPMAAGEAILFDESKLGFSSDPQPLVIERTPAAAPVSPPAVASRPAAQSPAPTSAAAAHTPARPPVVPTVPQQQPVARPPAAVATPAAQPVVNPPAAVAAPAAPQIVRPPAAAAAPAAPQVVRTPAAAAAPAAQPPAPATPQAPARPATPAPPAVTAPMPAPVVAREAPVARPAPAAAAAPTSPAAALPPAAASAAPAPAAEVAAPAATSSAGEPLDEAKEREAALFRLRMRAMLARLRTDEPEEGKG